MIYKSGPAIKACTDKTVVQRFRIESIVEYKKGTPQYDAHGARYFVLTGNVQTVPATPASFKVNGAWFKNNNPAVGHTLALATDRRGELCACNIDRMPKISIFSSLANC